MARYVLTGLDSAWTRRNRGAVLSLITEDREHRLDGPHSVSFDEALEHIRACGQDADVHALAIDQPLIVTNDTGRRPVEDVVAHVMGIFGSAVQPANRNKEMMFGRNAPIWPFLSALQDMGFVHNPHANERTQAQGRFYFEVYPALGNLGLFPRFYAGGIVPRYNPQRRTFKLEDWKQLCEKATHFLQRHGVACEWLDKARILIAPAKRTQDQMDSVLCICHALAWTRGDSACVVGDMTSGYMVVPSHQDLTAILRSHANDHGVGFWEDLA